MCAKRLIVGVSAVFILFTSIALSGVGRDPAGTAFTYQGRLLEDENAANGVYDLRFTLYDSETAGSQVGSPIERTGVTVEGGLVTVDLDFGSVADGNALWLEVAVRPAGTGTYTVLAPRQRLRPEPQALWSADAATFAGQPPSHFLDTSTMPQTKNGALLVAAGPLPGITASGDTLGGRFTNGSGTGSADLARDDWGIDAYGSETGGRFTDAAGAEVFLADTGTGIHASGPSGGGSFFITDLSATAVLAADRTGVTATGTVAGGSFSDSNSSGSAKVAYGEVGIDASGNQAGGHFSDANGTGWADVGVGDTGIEAHGQTLGGSFTETDGSSFAYLSGSGIGVNAEGTLQAGSFTNHSDSRNRAMLGTSSYGIDAGGATAAAHLTNDTFSGSEVFVEYNDGGGEHGLYVRSSGSIMWGTGPNGAQFVSGGTPNDTALLATAGFGIQAIGSSAGGRFTTGAGSGVLNAAAGENGLEASGDGAGGYLYDSDQSGYAYCGSGDRGVVAYGNTLGGHFADLDSSSYADVGIGTSKIAGSGAVSFVQNHPLDSGKVIVYAAPEGDEVAVYTRGSARLSGGEARVPLGETFRWVTDPDLGLTAYLTPVGDWCDLYVVSRSPEELVVRSRDGSDCAFDYIVWGLRIGFEDVTIVRPKTEEAFIPSMASHRTMIADDPTLARYTARSRFLADRKALGEDSPPDTARSAALRAAIHEFVPGVDPPPILPGTARRKARSAPAAPATTERYSHPPGPQAPPRISGNRLRRITDENLSAAARDIDLAARSFRSRLGLLATIMPSSPSVGPGDVVALDPGDTERVVAAAGRADPLVVGIASAEAGVTLAGADTFPKPSATVVLSGVTLCNVDAGYGAILPGDLLTASPTPGHAMRAADPLPGTVVAKALEPLAEGQGMIHVLLMLR